MKNYNSHYKKISSGFTLVEMLVVLGLFSFIMTLAVGVLYTTQAVNVKLQETQSVLDNVNLSMETMARDIRYGSEFHCASTLTESNIMLRKSCGYYGDHGGKVIFFKTVDAVNDNDRVAYYASTTSNGNVVLKDEYVNGATTTYQITTNDVKIRSLIFYVTGANTIAGTSTDVGDVHDYNQPLITVAISGETIPLKEGATSSTKFSMQSSIATRGIDK